MHTQWENGRRVCMGNLHGDVKKYRLNKRMKWSSILFIIQDIQIKASVKEWFFPIILPKIKIFGNIRSKQTQVLWYIVCLNVLVQLF